MGTLKYLAGAAGTALAFIALDATWLTLTSARLYKPAIGELLSDKVAMAPAVAFYVLYIAGIVILAVAPGLRAGSWTRTATSAAVLGLVAYGTYDLTNQATLKTWATRLTLADMAWGLVATTLAASAGFFAARAIGADKP